MASAGWMRWSGILASVLSLVIFAMWVVNGAQPSEVLGAARELPLPDFFERIARRTPEAGRAVLFLAGVTTTVAALLSLSLLTRGAALEAARYLGNAMGWAALSFTYLFFVSAIPLIATSLRESLGLLILCDMTSGVLLACAAHAFVRFWLLYPRPISAEELGAFSDMDEERQFREMTWGFKWMVDGIKWATGVFVRLSPKSQVTIDKLRGNNVFFYRLLAGKLFLPLAVSGLIVIVLLWRMGALFPLLQKGAADTLSLIAGTLFFGGFVGILIGFMAISITLHHTLGTAQERRSVEWIRAGLMINFVAFSLVQPVMFLIIVAMVIAPQIVTDWHLLSVLAWGWFLTLGTTPIVFIIALAASILYRGTLDPRLVLGRFTLWGALGLLLTFIFVLVERAVAMKVVEWFDLPPQTGAIVAGAAVAATFQPIRRFTEESAVSWTAKLMPTAMLAGGTRHEGAVAVADISGYTALSAKDEHSALLASALMQKDARRLAEAHEGRYVKSTGDGAILRFHTADEAMRAIRELHGAIARGAAALSIADLKLHSGLHWGEFVEARDGDIYGQTVNIAARIADRAQAGEIATSAAFAANLTSPDLSMKSIGPQQFKNVPEAIVCHLLAVG